MSIGIDDLGTHHREVHRLVMFITQSDFQVFVDREF